jgi:hypothetical protein
MNATCTDATAEMASALKVIGRSKDIAGNQARADWLRARGIRIPRLYGDVIVVIARAALKVS